MNIGIYFGSTTGNTEQVADLLSDRLKENTTIDYIENLKQSDLKRFDILIFGIPTWNIGELESSWENFFPNLDNFDFTDIIIALYGLGDQANYADTFQDAMGILYEKLIEKKAKIIGFWSMDDYNFSSELAIKNNKFVGLALDEDNQSEKTLQRIDKWICQLKDEYLELKNPTLQIIN
jgi:flavodoxin I